MTHPFAPYLDLANHHADATPEDIKKICGDVVAYGIHAVFVNACYIPLAKEASVRVGTVVSFPLGQDTLQAKRTAANEAVILGADELDVVPNIATFFTGDTGGFLSEMKSIVESARMAGKPVIVKFILEPGFFDGANNKLAEAALLVQLAGADYVKIGSGMGPRGPSLEDYLTVRKAVGPDMKIKVAGGITTYDQAKPFIDAGVTRIGTSHAVEIVKGGTSSEKTTVQGDE